MSEPGQLFDSAVGRLPAPVQKRESGSRLVSILPDAGVDEAFCYIVPSDLVSAITVGSIVQVPFGHRAVKGWVIELDVPAPSPAVHLLEVAKVLSVGPPADVVSLASWVAHHWCGRLRTVLVTASPKKFVRGVPAPRSFTVVKDQSDLSQQVRMAVEKKSCVSLCVSPTTRYEEIIQVAAERGTVLVLVPEVVQARRLVGAVRRLRIPVHLYPEQWGKCFSGGVIVGTRSAVFSPTPDSSSGQGFDGQGLSAILVFDEHDDSFQAQKMPTWHARDVAIERANRAGVSCLLVSPSPSVAAYKYAADHFSVSRSVQRAEWPLVELVDRRDEEPGRYGLFSPAMVTAFRSADCAVAVLNRKGRSHMLACRQCGELVRNESGRSLMKEIDGMLVSAEGERRPALCLLCGSTALKRLRLGISRAAEDLSILLGKPVCDMHAGSAKEVSGKYVVGTEAILHRSLQPDVVVFLDFDQELFAQQYRVAERAMSLLVRAARCVGSKGKIIVQTRVPDHRVLQAAVLRDTKRFASEEGELRQQLGFPPYGALAQVSGVGATEFIDRLRSAVGGASVLGPKDDTYLVRAATSEQLAEWLASVERPKQRCRIVVDPPLV